MSSSQQSATLANTPLVSLHLELGARLVPFAGYQMPVSYPAGIIAEHHACRSRAALFDVSHMGQVLLSGSDAVRALETLVPADIMGLAPDRQRYGFLTTADGGILDDIMVVRRDAGLMLIVNAGNKAAALDHLRSSIGDRCNITLLEDRALLALQGPAAAGVMQRHAPELPRLSFMSGTAVVIEGIPCYATRSGYTGEDGFEISVPADRAIDLARVLLAAPEVVPAGLGARDTLRLEAGLCLHGNDIGLDTTPVEAGLAWAIPPVRRPGGERAGGYPGAEVIARQLAHPPARKRVGLVVDGRMPVRAGTSLMVDGVEAGSVTSGTLSPMLNQPIALAYLRRESAVPGAAVQAVVRGNRIGLRVTPLPFVPHRYVRIPGV
ncbi:MAG: glycine cleavage system aminomethyltransferase GcvT [Steroidobacteraceae bacterium]